MIFLLAISGPAFGGGTTTRSLSLRTRTVLYFSKDQTAAACLERARDNDCRGVADQGTGMIDDDHCSIRQISNRLMRFATFFHQVEFHLVAEVDGRAQNFG